MFRRPTTHILSLTMTILLAGCATPSSSTPNGNDNTDLGEATLTVPEAGTTLLTVTESGDAGTASYFATEDVSGETFELAGFQADTSEGTITATADQAGQPTGITLDDLAIAYTHNDDGTIDYEITDSGTIVFSGVGIAVDEPVAKTTTTSLAGYSTGDITSCTQRIIDTWADKSSDIRAGRSCVETDPNIISTCVMLCVIKDVMLERLGNPNELCAPTCAGHIFVESCMEDCVARMDLAWARLAQHYALLYYTTEDVARQIGADYQDTGLCPGEEPTNCDGSSYVTFTLLDVEPLDGTEYWVCDQGGTFTNSHPTETVYLKLYQDESYGAFGEPDSWLNYARDVLPGQTATLTMTHVNYDYATNVEQRHHSIKYIAILGWPCVEAVQAQRDSSTNGQVDESAMQELGIIEIALPEGDCQR